MTDRIIGLSIGVAIILSILVMKGIALFVLLRIAVILALLIFAKTLIYTSVTKGLFTHSTTLLFYPNGIQP